MKQKYRVDKNNRLVIIRGAGILFADGRFVINKKNRLSYVVSETIAWRKKYDLPRKITFEGVWSLGQKHDLIFTLSENKEQFGSTELYLKSELLDAAANALIFSLGTKQKSGAYNIRLLSLRGRWQADKYNRLSFLVQTSGVEHDTLIITGAWQVNENNTLTYSYKKAYLKKKARIAKILTFKGFWQISEKGRIVYVLDVESNSCFSFKVSLETPSILAKRGEIRYRAGIGVKGRPLFRAQTVTLYGIWKLSRQLGLSFEMDYGQGRTKEIRFGAGLTIADKNEVELQLINSAGKDLGLSVTFSRSFLENKARWFLRLKKQGKDSRIEGGLSIPW